MLAQTSFPPYKPASSPTDTENVSMNPAKFVREVRQEMTKVTWPTRKETMISAAMVVIIAAMASVFFVAVDMVIGTLIKLVLGVGE
jgi:preprotein translocase subunit SecE